MTRRPHSKRPPAIAQRHRSAVRQPPAPKVVRPAVRKLPPQYRGR
jgi:hypothetical protein